jgi:hypothetical protein
MNANVHAVVEGGEYVHLALEIGEVGLHIARGAAFVAGAAGAVVSAAMLALTSEAYEQGVEDIAAQQRLGRRLGL